jgi:hypothetical protein
MSGSEDRNTGFMFVPAASPLTDAHLPRRRLLASYLQLQTKAKPVRTVLSSSEARNTGFMLVPAASPLTDAHLPRRRLLASYLQLQTKARAVRSLLVISQAKCLKCHATEHTPLCGCISFHSLRDYNIQRFTHQNIY